MISAQNSPVQAPGMLSPWRIGFMVGQRSRLPNSEYRAELDSLVYASNWERYVGPISKIGAEAHHKAYTVVKPFCTERPCLAEGL